MAQRANTTRGGCGRRSIWMVGALTLLALLICGGIWWLISYLDRAPASGAVAIGAAPTPRPAKSGEVLLRVAYTPEKRALFQAVVTSFNDANLRIDRKRVQVEAVELNVEDLVAQAAQEQFDAVSPDSSIWLDEIDRAWRAAAQGPTPEAAAGAQPQLVSETTHYMISPVVIAMWRDVAQRLGYPSRELGWQDILGAANSDASFRWSHPSPTTASGLLATLAAFYAGSGVTRGLTVEQATAPATLEYVRRLEATVKHYGEGELAVMQQIEAQGRAYLDAFIVQEQLVIQYNATHDDPLVAIYPVEGTLWQDHPLALLERASLTDAQRRAFALLRDRLLSAETQKQILSYGYRPADLTIALDGPDSPIRADNGADPAQPHTTLQVPSPAVIEVVKNVWWYTKRQANIYLVADTSGSMTGSKLSDAQGALKLFLDAIQGPEERVGLISFADAPHERVSLTRMADGRTRLEGEVAQLAAGGNTALLDSVLYALDQLEAQDDPERINAIVVMTDGQENSSSVSLDEVTHRLAAAYASQRRVVVFCIAYGRSADMDTLQALSDAGGGFTSTSDPETIRALYKTLSTYF